MTPLTLLPALAVLAAAVGVAAAEGDKGPAEKAVARLVHYSGRVQGVGFRYTVIDIARGYAVTGWVKNLDDGRVQLLVEGPEGEVKRFLDAVRARWKANVEKEQTEERQPTGHFRGFTIAR
jgi:acylphosphatase